jgi:integrase
MYTLTSWIRHWIETYAPLRCCSRKTIERYGSLAKYFETGPDPLRQVAETNLVNLSHIALEAGLLALQNFGQRKKRLSAKTVRLLGGLISASLQKAWRLDLIQTNPMRKVDLPRLAIREARFLTLEEMQSLRRVCREDWTFAYVELAMATGARRGELLALEWADLNRQTRVLTISKSLEETKAGLRVKTPKSGRSRRCTLPLVALEALDVLARSGALLFPDPCGGHRTPAYVSQIVTRRLRKAGIRNASLHTLRHSHASTLLSQGVPLPAVSVRLGHANPSITARIYAHAMPPDDARAADAWDLLLQAG